jgi:hypothetical protein
MTMRRLDASKRRFHRGRFTGILALALVESLLSNWKTFINSIERRDHLYKSQK